MCVFFIFNWSIIALQYCVGLCHTSTWISHRYTYVPSLFSLPLACHLILPLEVVTEHGLELSVSDCRFPLAIFLTQRRQWQPTPVLLPRKSHGRRSLVGCSPWGREESDTTSLSLSLFTSMHWRRKMATHSSVLAWRIPGTGSHRVRYDWGDLAAAVAIYMFQCSPLHLSQKKLTMLCLHHHSPSNCSHRASFLEEEGNVTADELWSKFSASA